MKRAFFLAALLFAQPATAKQKEVWIYTSMYKEVITPIKDAFEKANPGIKVHIFQSGSEKIQSKIEAELASKKPQADLINVSEPFWAEDLAQRGLLHRRSSGENYLTSYYSASVLIAHKDYPVKDRPDSFKSLTDPKYKGLIQMGSPLESGTMFSVVAYLSDVHGWNFFEKMRANKLAANGGNSTVIQKVESGEKKLGIVLVENVVAAKKRGSPIEIIYPKDGAIVTPSVQFILKDSPHKEEAAKFGEFLIGKEGQKFAREGYMYSVRKDIAAPEGVLPFEKVIQNSKVWKHADYVRLSKESKNIKKRFAGLILE